MSRFKTKQNFSGDHRPGDARHKVRPWMPSLGRVVVLGKIFAVVWAVLIFSVLPVQAGGMAKQAPDFSLPALSGRELGLKSYRGKVVWLNFWASWCTPCKEELPELERIHHAFRDRPFEVLGINIDKRRKNAVKLVERFGLSFAILLDPEAEVIQRYPGRAMPISYLIDPEGLIRGVFFGYNPEKLPQMKAAIKELLHENWP